MTGILQMLGSIFGAVFGSALPQVAEWRAFFAWQFVEWCAANPPLGWLILVVMAGSGVGLVRRVVTRMLP